VASAEEESKAKPKPKAKAKSKVKAKPMVAIPASPASLPRRRRKRNRSQWPTLRSTRAIDDSLKAQLLGTPFGNKLNAVAVKKIGECLHIQRLRLGEPAGDELRWHVRDTSFRLYGAVLQQEFSIVPLIQFGRGPELFPVFPAEWGNGKCLKPHPNLCAVFTDDDGKFRCCCNKTFQ
jgi:hypothetical protein